MSIKTTPALTTSAIGAASPNAYFINSLTIDGVPDIAKALATSYGSISDLSPEQAVTARVTADPKVVALSSFYVDATRFIGGTTSCPDFVKPSEAILPKNANDWKKYVGNIAAWMDVKARACYLYYVLNHATRPWLALERPGLSAADPHTNTNPNQAILQTCQPLLRGDVADFLQFPHSDYSSKTNMRKLEERSGFAHVNSSGRADVNEHEYVLNYSLASQWYANFLSFGNGYYSIDDKLTQGGNPKIFKDFQATYQKFISTTITPPCVVNAGGGGHGGGVYGAQRSKIWYPPDKCPQWLCYGFWHSAGPIRNNSVGVRTEYCPNVERVIDPSGPFNPRNEYVRNVYSRAVRLMNGEYASKTGDDDSTVQPSSDRSYSTFTSIFFLREYPPGTPCCYEGPIGTWTPSSGAYCNSNPDDPECGVRSCHRWKCGYTSYNCIQPRTPPYMQWTWSTNLKKKYPPVQCAVVPVEIMNFRFDSFHSCITQRIAINFNRWIDRGAPNFNGLHYGRDRFATTPDIEQANINLAQSWMQSKNTDSPNAYASWGTTASTDPNLADQRIYKPACATRYWETDNAYDCPTPTSIQQCCRFITKDLVPTNFLKMRTCEGLLQKRIAAKKRMEAIGVITRLTFDPIDPDRKWPESGEPPDNMKAVTWINEYATGTSNGVGKHQHVVAEAGNRILNDYSCNAVEHSELRFRTGRNSFRDPYTGENLGYNMPYMRWWDTGVSAGNVHRGGSFGNTLGSWDVIVGVGREERTSAEAYYAQQKRSAQKHSLGNQRPSPQFDISGQRSSQISRINGWEGILAHQMHSIRRFNLNCLTRYEKTFKPYSAEDFVLASAGGSYNTPLGRKMPWPLGWRGYVSSGQFPYHSPALLSGGDAQRKGLDNARRGDIVQYLLSDGQWHLGYVEYADYTPDTRGAVNTNPRWDFEKAQFSGMSKAPNNLYVVSWDQGRFPTATGATTYQGIGARRQIMKQSVPSFYKTQVCKKKLMALTSKGDEFDMTCQNPIIAECGQCEPSCDDPDYKYCVLPIVGGQHSWDTARIYRPAWDPRKHGSLSATFAWWEKQKESPTKPLKYDPNTDKDVILQALTYKYSASMFANMVNTGYDPPWFWFMGGYKGPGTGAVTGLTFKGGKWGLSNSKVDKSQVRCFQGNGDGGQSCNKSQ